MTPVEAQSGEGGTAPQPMTPDVKDAGGQRYRFQVWPLQRLALTLDGGVPEEGGVTEDGGAPEDGGGLLRCESVDDCPKDDGAFCNGVIACERYRSSNGSVDTGDATVCVQVQPCPVKLLDKQGKVLALICDEQGDTCDCDPRDLGKVAWYCAPDETLSEETHTLDVDNDNVNYDKDCDDADGRRSPGKTELCDEAGLDEDCKLSSVVAPDRAYDKDGDGHYDAKCLNIDPATGLVVKVPNFDDCDDGPEECGDQCHPNRDERCDGYDNDCDTIVDERAGVPYGRRQEYCLDRDGDGFAPKDARPVIVCPADARARYVPCPASEARYDCDDDPEACGASCNPDREERCDGYDNDCDHVTDRKEDDMGNPLLIVGEPDKTGHEFVCGCPPEEAGCSTPSWYPTRCPDGRQWCYPDSGSNGCTTDITALGQCGGCEPTNCKFACDWSSDAPGCEELAQIDVGRESVCAVTDRGRLACWGRGAEGQLGDGDRRRSTKPVLAALQDVHQVSVGLRHACAIAGDTRTAYCWGSDARSHLTTDDEAVVGLLGSIEAYGHGSDTPVEVSAGDAEPRLTAVEEIALGAYHACARLSSGRVLCWGDHHEGRLGGPYHSTLPSFVVDASGIPIEARDLGVGETHACAVSVAGEVLCWGSNAHGELGYPRDHDFSEPATAPAEGMLQNYRPHAAEVPGIAGIDMVEAGAAHTCALDRAAHLWCWGDDRLGQLGPAGTGGASYNPTPTVLAVLGPVAQVAAGAMNTCVIMAAPGGDVVCWGVRALGIMGKPLEGIQRDPVALDLELPETDWISISTSLCLSSSDGSAHCLGANDHGQLGDGKPPTPFPVPAQQAVASLVFN